MSNNKVESKCTLSDNELIERCNEWVRSLAKTGGDSWVLQVPVNFNRDPDMLFIELGKRLQEHTAELSQLREERDRLVKALEKIRGMSTNYGGDNAWNEIHNICDTAIKKLTNE